MKNESKKSGEAGAALVIALLVMMLLMAFAALALSRTASETVITMNDTADSRTFNAAEAALEDATRDFATVVERKLVPNDDDIKAIKDKKVPYFEDNNYSFTKVIKQIGVSQVVTQTKGEFQGLVSLRDEWQIDVTARDKATGVENQVRRRFFNDRIPIFQFGAFYNDDLELNRPPLFVFGGRVHTNGNMFLSSSPASGGAGIYFKSKLTAAGEIVNDIWKTGTALANGTDNSGDIYVPNTTDVNQKLSVGNASVNCNGSGSALVDPTGRNFPYPKCKTNTNWTTFAQRFEGNLKAKVSKLELPIDKLKLDLIEMMRRGKNVGDMANIGGALGSVTAANQDGETVSKERFANKPGIRISLADAQNKLPQCANVVVNCGVRLDGALGSSLGYQPLTMNDGYKATALNGNRIAVSGRQIWIKIELVDFDGDNGVPVTKDVTQDILSLGVTEPAPIDSKFNISGYSATTDSRSIIKMQRFVIDGSSIGNPTSTSYVTGRNINSKDYNLVSRFSVNSSASSLADCPTQCVAKDNFAAPFTNGGVTSVSSNETAHYKLATSDGNLATGGSNRFVIVPFPIKLFDTREGARADSNGGLASKYVFKNGVMSLIDIDVANLRKFLNGDFDGLFPITTPFAVNKGNQGLRVADVPNLRGWVVYFSDRRGDADFDGRYDMEDVNPNSDSLTDEDINNNGTVDTDYINEAPTQNSSVEAGYAAVTDHTYYRRGVRLINGSTVPGTYNAATPTSTKGFTFASENGIYVWKNYNATSVNLPGGSQVADSSRYQPQDTQLHIPAAIVGDAVTILSNSWNDSKSFLYPFAPDQRVASDTQVRFAMISGDSLTASPNPAVGAGNGEGLNGGLHNFKRFLEVWDSKRLNYSGSLINLYNAYNNNGRWKCCNTVYRPPIRDWTFETTFTNPNRLPPGTPFVYYITFTGFERVND